MHIHSETLASIQWESLLRHFSTDITRREQFSENEAITDENCKLWKTDVVLGQYLSILLSQMEAIAFIILAQHKIFKVLARAYSVMWYVKANCMQAKIFDGSTILLAVDRNVCVYTWAFSCNAWNAVFLRVSLQLTKAVASRSTASKVLAEVKVVSLLVLASFLISTYALTM